LLVETIGIGTACLPTDDDKSGAECSITGWGTTASSGPVPDTLQEASVTVINDTDCARAYAKQNDTVTWHKMGEWSLVLGRVLLASLL